MTHTPDFTEKAMLARLKIKCWKATVRDREVSDDVADRYQSDRAYGSFSKRLLPKDALQTVQRAARAAREFHAVETLPWHEDGSRILPAKNFLRYAGEIRRLRAEFETAARDFVAGYPQFREDARVLLGNLYREEDYPSLEQIADAFGFETEINPLPSGRDFRVQLSQEEVEALQADIERRTHAAMLDATRDLWTRAEEAITRLRDRAVALDGEDKAVFRGAVLEAVHTVTGLMDRLNVTDDPGLLEVRARIEAAFAGVDVETVRQSPEARSNVRAQADAILAMMGAYTGQSNAPAAQGVAA